MCSLRICSANPVSPERWRALASSPAQLDDPAIEPRCSVHGGVSRKCNGSRGKLMRTCEQKVNKEEKLTLTFHRNLLNPATLLSRFIPMDIENRRLERVLLRHWSRCDSELPRTGLLGSQGAHVRLPRERGNPFLECNDENVAPRAGRVG